MDNNSRTRNSILNISTGLIKQTITLLISFISRTIFIWILGDECLGLNGLFTSILSILSLAELGIGQAITFYLYKPIAENDIEKQKTLIRFYKTCYRMIGIGIIIVGISIIPLLPKLVNFQTNTGYNLYFIYVLYLMNTAITYLFFSYPQTFLIANQKESIVNNNESIFCTVQAITEIVVLFITKDYIAYLFARIIIQVIKNCRLLFKTIRLYPFINDKTTQKIDRNELKSMFHDVYSIFVVRVSSSLFNATDNLFISAIIGTIYAGYNSNYLMIINAVYGVVSTIFYSFAGSVGNLYAVETKEKTKKTFELLDFCNRWISCFCTVCLFTLLNPFISIVWGDKYTFELINVALMCIDFYLVSSLYNLFNFRQSMGLFRYCVYNQLIAAIVNIILDFVLIYKFGITGLFLATVISKLTISIFPYIVNFYKAGFGTSSKYHIISIVKGYLVCIIACLTSNFIASKSELTIPGFIIKLSVAVLVSNILFIICNANNKNFKELINVLKILKSKFGGNKG